MKLLGKAKKICLLNLTLYIDMVPYGFLGLAIACLSQQNIILRLNTVFINLNLKIMHTRAVHFELGLRNLPVKGLNRTFGLVHTVHSYVYMYI